MSWLEAEVGVGVGEEEGSWADSICYNDLMFLILGYIMLVVFSKIM